MGCGDDPGHVLFADQGDDVTDLSYTRDFVRALKDERDALLDENQREQHRAEIAEIALEDREAENQRLREALEAFFFEYDSGKEYAGCAPSDPVEQKMREALAGDTE